MTMTVHEKLIEKLFQEYQREPPSRLGSCEASGSWLMQTEGCGS